MLDCKEAYIGKTPATTSVTVSGLEQGKIYYVDFSYYSWEIEEEEDEPQAWYFKRAVMVT